jgi:hypothetical protein
MLTKSKIAISLALILGTASAAVAASKHTVHRHVSFGSARDAGRTYGSFPRDAGPTHEPSYMGIQDQDWRNQIGG